MRCQKHGEGASLACWVNFLWVPTSWTICSSTWLKLRRSLWFKKLVPEKVHSTPKNIVFQQERPQQYDVHHFLLVPCHIWCDHLFSVCSCSVPSSPTLLYSSLDHSCCTLKPCSTGPSLPLIPVHAKLWTAYYCMSAYSHSTISSPDCTLHLLSLTWLQNWNGRVSRELQLHSTWHLRLLIMQ